MRKTKYNETDGAIMVTTEQLRKLLNCGYHTATHIGEQAKARVFVGKRVLYHVAKIKNYLDKISM